MLVYSLDTVLNCNNCQWACIGLGGGYNERENVEYVQREESDDDEFDEVSLFIVLFYLVMYK